jgi:hypothetical protein
MGYQATRLAGWRLLMDRLHIAAFIRVADMPSALINRILPSAKLAISKVG